MVQPVAQPGAPPTAQTTVRPTGRQRLNELIARKGFEEGVTIARNLPVHVFLQLTSSHDLDGLHGSQAPPPREPRSARSMSPGLFSRIVTEVFPYSQRVTFGIEGEPMLSGHFLDYATSAFHSAQEIQVITNGLSIDNDETAKILTACVSDLQISIDAATPETYERIRAGSRWSSLQENLERVRRCRSLSPSGNKQTLTLRFVLMRSNVHELPSFVEMAEKLGADRVSADHVIPVTEESHAESLAVDPDHYRLHHIETLKMAGRCGIRVELPSPIPKENTRPPLKVPAPEHGSSLSQTIAPPQAPPPSTRTQRPRIPCPMPNYEVHISWDGRVYPCGHPYARRKILLGDLTHSSFFEIWNGRRYRNLRAGLAQGDPLPICDTCPLIHRPAHEHDFLKDVLETPWEIGSYYGDRDLAPCHDSVPKEALVETLIQSGVGHHILELSAHASALEVERKHLRRSLVNRLARFVRRHTTTSP